MDDFTGPPQMPRPGIIHPPGRDLAEAITLEETPQGWVLAIHDGLDWRRAVLPDSVANALAARIARPVPVASEKVEWGIRWAEDLDTVQGPMDEDYAKRKASPAFGDVLVRRTITEYRPGKTPWEPVEG